jgi:hypothetical protein
MMSSAFHDTVDAMSLIQSKAHDSLLQRKKRVFTGPIFLTCYNQLHSVRLSSVLLAEAVFSGRIPVYKKVESLLPYKEEGFSCPYYVL